MANLTMRVEEQAKKLPPTRPASSYKRIWRVCNRSMTRRHRRLGSCVAVCWRPERASMKLPSAWKRPERSNRNWGAILNKSCKGLKVVYAPVRRPWNRWMPFAGRPIRASKPCVPPRCCNDLEFTDLEFTDLGFTDLGFNDLGFNDPRRSVAMVVPGFGLARAGANPALTPAITKALTKEM